MALLPASLLPTVGGLATGVVALYYPEVLYQGFGASDFSRAAHVSMLLSPSLPGGPMHLRTLNSVISEHLLHLAGNVNAILQARTADYAPVLLLEIVAAKIATTAVCRGSGLVGGIYAPSIFIGMAPLDPPLFPFLRTRPYQWAFIWYDISLLAVQALRWGLHLAGWRRQRARH